MAMAISILPDMEIIDLANRSAAVNALILYDLAKRAERDGDPYENLEAMYHMAEVSWERGDYELIKAGMRR
jgi:predicted enzyme involved in methoxymalonyl-ACP biosynthesis